ncbi:putative squalene monooxygenase isoform X1 [Apostichopus japonicus]|uniref:Squalene monooxygenase n=1 Tax=Stichopus japonicus TaxID=307972 RepID=A0A2G8JD90_STIJA|nr:putative squalene monooxygenase isoform X1 [Apostichopus japonicus]
MSLASQFLLPFYTTGGAAFLSAALVGLLGLYFFFASRSFKVKKSNSTHNAFHQRCESGTTDETEIIIVGSGILGSAMAAVLGQDGRRVTVIERDLKQPDRIVGELLQPGGYEAVKALGLKDCVEGLDAHEVKGYIIHAIESKISVEVPYPSQEEDVYSGRSFHHGRFVMGLRKAARAQPSVSYIEGVVTKIMEQDGVITGVTYRQKDHRRNQAEFPIVDNKFKFHSIHRHSSHFSQNITAPLTIVADGCFSKFRKTLVNTKPQTSSHFAGLIIKDCPQFKDNHAELVLAKPSPILIYKIASHDTRVLVDIPDKMPKDMKGYMLENILPQLPDHIKESFHDSVVNGGIRSMPNSFLPPAPIEKSGVLLLGDAYNMRHPLTGGGMSVALNDVKLWRELFKEMKNETMKQCQSPEALPLAEKEISFFCGQRAGSSPLRSLCRTRRLSPNPVVLIGHFFAVAVYAILFTFRDRPWYLMPLAVMDSFLIFIKACGVLFPLIFSEFHMVLSC